MDDTRFYSFVAGLYLSPLQRGLQTAHAVSEMYKDYRSFESQCEEPSHLFDQWATQDKTIIILDALNARGVKEAHAKLREFVIELKDELPISIFYEDEDSLNGAATAAGVVVPKQFYDVTRHEDAEGNEYFTHQRYGSDGVLVDIVGYGNGTVEYEFVKFLKSYRLAQS